MSADDSLGTVGEAATLRRIIERLPAAETALLGPGDDSAVLRAPDGRYVVSTDLLVHGPDFRLAWSTPYDLGWKAAASNLADIAAMGARPTALVVALAAPLDTPVTDLERIADGLRDACAALAPGTGVVGGDLSASATLTIAVTVFGGLSGRNPVLRSGARPGDVVAVTGGLGRAAAGLRLMFRDGVDDNGIPDRARFSELVKRRGALVDAQLRPSPSIASGEQAAVAGATAMMDVSDGLTLDASRLAAASGARIDFRLELLVGDARAIAASAPELSDEAVDLVLTGGEDHGMLATFPSEAVPDGFRVIGAVMEGDGVTVDGRDPAQSRGGWDPFGDWNGSVG